MPMPQNARKFIESAASVGILSAAEADTIRGKLSPEALDADAEALVRDMIRAGKVTKYQAANIYQGRGKGLIFGDYVVLDKLGQGGMGQVFKAQHRRMKRVVALKVLPPQATASPKNVQRFYQEVEVAAKLIHPNIVTSYDAGEARGLHYLVMEYVEGQDLSAYVTKKGPLSIEQAMNCILQAARGLGYAHGLGIVHRDIKPSNLLLDHQGTVKILDMGLARVERPMSSPDEKGNEGELTDQGTMMGTVDYIAPEQAIDTRTADARADIYSLGCSLYKVLTGKSVYAGDTTIKKILAHREAPIPSLKAARQDVPDSLDRLFQKMLIKDPAARIQPITEVVTALEQMLSGVDPDETSVVMAADAIDHEMGDFLKSMSASAISGSSVSKRTVGSTPSETLIPAQGSTSSISKGRSPKAAATQAPKKNQMLAIGACCVSGVVTLAIAAYLIFGGGSKQPPPKDTAATDFTQSGKSKSPDKTKTKTPEKSTGTPVIPVVTPPAAPLDFSMPVNLLKLIDVKRDGAAPGWQFEGGALIVPAAEYARLQIPVAPPPEYDIEMTVERIDGNRSIDLGIPYAGKQPLVQVDGENDISGLSLIDGKPADQNETRFSGSTLLSGPNAILYSVRKTGILVRCNNNVILRWMGDSNRLSSVASMSMPKGDQLLIGSHKASFRIAKMDLLPPGPGVEELLAAKPEPAPTPFMPATPKPVKLTAPVDLMALIDPAMHGRNGTWTKQGSTLSIDVQGGGFPYAIVPFAMPEEYDVTMTVDNGNATQSVGIVVPMGSRQVGVQVDMYRVGLQRFDNLGWYMNASTRRGTFITSNKPAAITCVVRKDQIFVTIDGRPALSWTEGSRLPQTNDIANLPQPQLQLFAQPPAKFTKLEISPPALPSYTFTPIDVLALVDPKRDGNKIDVKREGRDLVIAPPAADGYLTLPLFRPNEYVLTMVVERLAGQEGLRVSLPFEGARPSALFDGYNRSLSGLELISNAFLNNNNNTSIFKDSCLLLPDRPHTLVCTVGRDTIFGTCDGRTVFQWARQDGPLGEFPNSPVDHEPMFLHTFATGWRISKLEVAPLGWKRLSVPPTDALAKAREALAPLVDPSKPKAASAEVLLVQAAQTTTDLAARYAMLEESLRLACDAGNLPLAMNAAEDLSAIFEVDSRELEKRVVADVFKAAKSGDARFALLNDSLKWLARATGEQRFDLAGDLRTAAATLKVGNADFQKDFQKELKTQGLEFGQWKTEQDAYRAALQTLATKPDDASAHAAAGRYLCLVAGDWKAGSAHLDRGSDVTLKSLVNSQIENPREVDKQVALGDRWWDLYEKSTGPSRWIYLEQAAHWYRSVGARAAGKVKITLDQRRQKIITERKASGAAFAARHPLDAVKIGEHWYKFYPTLAGWQQAADICEKLGGQLLTIETPAENNAVAQFLLSRGGNAENVSVWLGASDQEQEGTFRWLDGTPLTSPAYSNWGAGQPDNFRGNEDWVTMTVTLQNGAVSTSWNDAASSEPPNGGNYFFVCEWDR